MMAGSGPDELSPWPSRPWKLGCCVGESGVDDGDDMSRQVGSIMVREVPGLAEEAWTLLEEGRPWPSSMPERLYTRHSEISDCMHETYCET